ncbi:MAG: hypothetical protein GXP37_01205 [Chloroflexi bacterium]|nr:hypothetical protein [Chloroflexota bacterium]
MRKHHSTSWLDRYLEALQTANEAQTRFMEQSVSDMSSLFRLVRLLWMALQPVRLNAVLRAELKQSLVAEARRRQVQDALGLPTQPASGRRGWWAPVAVLGTASLVGAYALWRRSRPEAIEDMGMAA